MSSSLSLAKGFSFGAETINYLTSRSALEGSLDIAKWYIIFRLF